MNRPLATLLAFSAVIGPACASTPSNPQGSAIPLPSPSASTIVLNPDKIWFDPPGGDQPKLTSSEALAMFEAADPEFNPPAEPTPQLGRYTDAVGDGTYLYKEQLAWGYTWHQCAPQFGNPPPDAVVSCTAWLFLDANTGEMFELTWQKG